MKVGAVFGQGRVRAHTQQHPPPASTSITSSPTSGAAGGKRARLVPSVPTTPGFRRPRKHRHLCQLQGLLSARLCPQGLGGDPTLPGRPPPCPCGSNAALCKPALSLPGLLRLTLCRGFCVLTLQGVWWLGIGGWSRLSEGLVWPSKPVVCSPQSCSFGLPLGWLSWGCRSVPAPWRGLQWQGGGV